MATPNSAENQVKLGHLLDGPENRDAVHVAVYAVRAGEDLKPGQPVGVNRATGNALAAIPPLGVVDPFLALAGVKEVKKDQWFWLFLTPGTATGLRHHYHHPAFDRSERSSPSTPSPSGPANVIAHASGVVAGAADRFDLDYAELLAAAMQYQESGVRTVTNREDLRDAIDRWAPERLDRFWDAVGVLTGHAGPPERVFPYRYDPDYDPLEGRGPPAADTPPLTDVLRDPRPADGVTDPVNPTGPKIWRSPASEAGDPDPESVLEFDLKRQAAAMNRIFLFADSLGLEDHTLMEAATRYVSSGERTPHPVVDKNVTAGEWAQFWADFAVVTGPVPEDRRGCPFVPTATPQVRDATAKGEPPVPPAPATAKTTDDDAPLPSAANLTWFNWFAGRVGVTPEVLLAAADRFVSTGRPTNVGSNDRFADDDVWGLWPEFWERYKALAGRAPAAEDQKYLPPFTCSC